MLYYFKVGIFYFLSFFLFGQAHEILDYVKEALIDSTMQNVFMDDVTKSKAKAKVGNINIFLRRSKTEKKPFKTSKWIYARLLYPL